MEHRAQFATLMQYTLELLFLKQEIEKGACASPENDLKRAFDQSNEDVAAARIEMARLMDSHSVLAPREVLSDACDSFKQQQDEPAIRDVADMIAAGLLRDFTAIASPPKALKERLKTYAVVAAIIAAVGGYFGTRAYAAVNVDHAIETSEGLSEHASAWRKVARYDNWASTRVRRGGMFKGVLLWPIEPTDEEMGYAADFANLAVGILYRGEELGFVCGAPASYDSTTFSDEEIDFISDAAEWLPGHIPTAEDTDPLDALGDFAMSRYPCAAG